jgi:circadian clock protein KaiB
MPEPATYGRRRARPRRHSFRISGLARISGSAHVLRATRGTTRKEEFLPAYVLKLYVTGSTPRANLAIANLRRICEQELNGDYELVIIDVLEQPQLAEDERILATPTLIKQLPPPLRRVIGDLSDSEKVLLGLELRTGESTSKRRTET